MVEESKIKEMKMLARQIETDIDTLKQMALEARNMNVAQLYLHPSRKPRSTYRAGRKVWSLVLEDWEDGRIKDTAGEGADPSDSLSEAVEAALRCPMQEYYRGIRKNRTT